MKSLLEQFGALGLGLVMVLGASACTDDGGDDGGMDDVMDDTTDGMDTTDTTDTGGALSHAADIQPIWDANCVTSCHEAGQPTGDILDLSTDGYDDLVGVPSGQATGSNMVEAGDASMSYLIAKLDGTHVEFGGTGAQMPFGVDPLSDADINLITQWIDEGAAP